MKSHRKVLRWHPTAVITGIKGSYSIMATNKDGNIIKLGGGATYEQAWDNALVTVKENIRAAIYVYVLCLMALTIIGLICYLILQWLPNKN